MNKEEALRIINTENLVGYNLNEERYDKEDEVVIKRDISDWIVYVTNERASIIPNSLYKYSTEEEALDDFINRLRADKRLRELYILG